MVVQTYQSAVHERKSHPDLSIGGRSGLYRCHSAPTGTATVAATPDWTILVFVSNCLHFRYGATGYGPINGMVSFHGLMSIPTGQSPVTTDLI